MLMWLRVEKELDALLDLLQQGCRTLKPGATYAVFWIIYLCKVVPLEAGMENEYM